MQYSWSKLFVFWPVLFNLLGIFFFEHNSEIFISQLVELVIVP